MDNNKKTYSSTDVPEYNQKTSLHLTHLRFPPDMSTSKSNIGYLEIFIGFTFLFIIQYINLKSKK